jgi:coenzyme F420 biosynthesis associated uncharacterized protein
VSTDFVDWRLAERVATAMAGSAATEPGSRRPFGPQAVRAAFEDALPSVSAYTGLQPDSEIPAAESIDRAAWARAGITNLRDLSAGLEQRLSEGLSLPGPLNGVVRGIAGRAAAAEAGAAVGLAARRVLGQFDIALGESKRAPRLYLVEPNLVSTHRELGGDPELFLEWIALHETTHALQFGGVPWLRDHISSLLGELIESSARGIDGAQLRSLARKLVTSDPRETVRKLMRGEAARLLAGPEQAALLDRLQAVMSVVEGYAEHVMDHASPEREAELAKLRDRLDVRRESRSGLGNAIARLLGLEMKMQQYRLGKAFCDDIVDRGGVDALNVVWSSPDALPRADELEAPAAWFDRVGAVAHA